MTRYELYSCLFFLIYNSPLIQIPNSYMTLVMDRCNDVYVFSSFFYTKLSVSVVHMLARYIELFSKRKLLFPVHHTNHCCLHWFQ